MASFLFFGRFSDLSHELTIDIPEKILTTDDLFPWLDKQVPGLLELLSTPGSRVAVNQAVVSGVTSVSNDDEIAFMSALSGG